MRRTKLLKGATYATYLYIFVMFFLVMFFNIPGVFAFSIPKQVIAFLFGGAAFIGALFLLREKLHLDRLIGKDNRKNLAIVFGVLFIVQLLFVSRFYSQVAQDAHYIYTVVIGQPHPDWGLTYFSNYPNNLVLLFFQRFVHNVNMLLGNFIDFYWILVVINIMAVDVSIYLTYKIAKKIFSQKIALHALALSILLLGFTPWLTAVYSDTLSMPMGLLIFYFYLKIKDQPATRQKLMYGVLIGMFAYLGFLIKPAAIFSGLAIVVVEVLMCNYKALFKNMKQIGLIISVGAAVLVGMLHVRLPYDYAVAHQQIVDYDESQNFPFTHWIMMGLAESELKGFKTYGFWNAHDYELTGTTIGKEAKRRRHISHIAQRLRAFGPVGYAKYLLKKSIWFLGDGTFFWGHEGVLDPVTPHKGISRIVQNIVYSSGAYYHYYAYVLQTMWFIVLGALATALFGVKKYASKEFYIVTCTIAGTLAFILFFEGRSRYLINNLGFFILGASVGLTLIIDKLNKLRRTKNSDVRR